MFRIDAQMTAMLAELARIGTAPSLSTIQRLEATLQDSLDFSQGIVRVDTGSLRNSGVTETDLGMGVWAGTLTYGGPSPGAIHDPVDYTHQVIAYDAPSDWISVTVQTFTPRFAAAVAAEFV